MKHWYWCGAAVCLAAAVALVTLPGPAPGVQNIMRLAAFAAMLGAVGCTVQALNRGRRALEYDQLCPAPWWQGGPGRVPPPPAMPVGLPLGEVSRGSVAGAVKALPEIAGAFAAPPMLAWQFERWGLALGEIETAVEREGADPALAADFSVQYLPSAMQYLTACAAEGCPENAEATLTLLALAAEKQQDALAAGEYATFEQEYYALRAALTAARFRWQAV